MPENAALTTPNPGHVVWPAWYRPRIGVRCANRAAGPAAGESPYSAPANRWASFWNSFGLDGGDSSQRQQTVPVQSQDVEQAVEHLRHREIHRAIVERVTVDTGRRAAAARLAVGLEQPHGRASGAKHFGCGQSRHARADDRNGLLALHRPPPRSARFPLSNGAEPRHRAHGGRLRAPGTAAVSKTPAGRAAG